MAIHSSQPQSIVSLMSIVGDSSVPMALLWGVDCVLFYNEGFAPLLGVHHPRAMGRPVREAWPSLGTTIAAAATDVLRGGGATADEDVLLPMPCAGHLRERYFTFAYSPIADSESVCGVLCTAANTTQKVVAERRLRALRELQLRPFGAIEFDALDVPFSRVYLFDESGQLGLRASSGFSPSDRETWPIDDVIRTRSPKIVPSTIGATAALVQSAAVESAIVLPIATAAANNALGAMVIGLSPFANADDEYRHFLELVAGQVAARTVARGYAANERGLRMLADAIPQIVCTAAPNGKIDYFNGRWFEFTGLTEEQTFHNAGWLEAIHPDDRPVLQPRLREAVESGTDFSVELRVRSRAGKYRWFLARAVALREDNGSVIRFFSTATDIDEQKRIEERESFLSHVSEQLSSTLDVHAILQKITEICVPTFADWCQVQSLTPDDDLVVEAVSHSDPELNARLEMLVGRAVVSMRDASRGSPQVLREAQSRMLDHEMTLRAVRENVPDADDRAIYEAAGLGTALIVPLVARGQVRGTLHLVDIDPNSRRPEGAVEIAEELARRAAVAIDNSRLYEREHRVASALQQAMLPTHLPSHPRVELSYAYRPAERESRVGGDWYDAFLISEGRVAISIGDVGGHGLEAAVAMNEARHALRLSALEGMTPAQTLRRANAALMLNDQHPMITAVFGVIDVARATFRYSCAGHPPPAIAPLCGRARYIDGGGIPLGVEVTAPFPALSVELEPYSTLLLYTDGLIEYDRNIERESGRLLDALSARVQDRTSDGAGILVRCVLDNRQIDDIAVLAATFLPAQAAPIELRLPAAPTSAAIARRLALRYARVAKLSPDRIFDLTIAVGEAVANAVEHAYRGGTGDFVLRLATHDDRILGEVQDLGTWRHGGPDADRGRGLTILRAATARFELKRSPHGTKVAFAV